MQEAIKNILNYIKDFIDSYVKAIMDLISSMKNLDKKPTDVAEGE